MHRSIVYPLPRGGARWFRAVGVGGGITDNCAVDGETGSEKCRCCKDRGIGPFSHRLSERGHWAPEILPSTSGVVPGSQKGGDKNGQLGGGTAGGTQVVNSAEGDSVLRSATMRREASRLCGIFCSHSPRPLPVPYPTADTVPAATFFAQKKVLSA